MAFILSLESPIFIQKLTEDKYFLSKFEKPHQSWKYIQLRLVGFMKLTPEETRFEGGRGVNISIPPHLSPTFINFPVFSHLSFFPNCPERLFTVMEDIDGLHFN